jgi:hypothetical protein
MNLAEVFEKEAARHSRSIGRRLEEERETLRKVRRESLGYAATGALAGPLVTKARQHVEFKGKIPAHKIFYRLAGRKIPSWVPASMIPGAMAGMIPYVRKRGKIIRQMREAHEKKGAAELLSPRIFRPPHTRGVTPIIPERTKQFASRLLKGRQAVGSFRPKLAL